MRVLAPHIEEELLVATQRAWMQLLHTPRERPSSDPVQRRSIGRPVDAVVTIQCGHLGDKRIQRQNTQTFLVRPSAVAAAR